MIDTWGVENLAEALATAALDARLFGTGFIKFTQYATGRLMVERLDPVEVEVRLKEADDAETK